MRGGREQGQNKAGRNISWHGPPSLGLCANNAAARALRAKRMYSPNATVSTTAGARAAFGRYRIWPIKTGLSSGGSNVDLEQTGERAIENPSPLLVVQSGNGKNAVNRIAIPQRWIVCSQDNLAGAHYRNQMSHVLGRKEHGVVIELLEILAGQFLQGPAILGKGLQTLT